MISWMYGVRPAKLTWDASASCDDNHVSEIFIPSSNADGAVDYYTLVSSKIRLAALPLNIKFNPILPGESDTREIYLEAVNGDIAIDKIELQNDILFDIIEGKVSSPFVLPKGQQHKVIVKYSPVDSTIQFTKLLITSSACVGNEVLIAAGYPNTPPKEKTIKITSPVCKETLILGDEHYVEWEGLLPEDVIQLEYSLNEGASWDTLATNVKGLKYKWDIPNVETDDALVRAIQLWPNNIGRTMNLKHWAQVNSAFFNTFGDKIVTASGDSSAVVWNSNTGAKLLTLKKHSHEVNYAVFSFDNQYIATASKDSTVILWNAVTGDSLGTIIQKEKVNSVNFSHNSKAIVTASSDGTVKIYDVNTLALIRNIDAYTSTKRAWYAEYDPTDSYILTAGNAVYARLYNAVGSGAGTLYKQFKVQESDYGCPCYF
jgi:WD40 repeat protein